MAAGQLVFIGLDGVSLAQARALANEGVMPNLARLMGRAEAQEGLWSTASPLPEVSPVCWTSMFTGLGPGGHGVYGFAHPTGQGYAVRPAEAGDVRAPRIWDQAGAGGRRVAVLGVPLTYPAAPVNGVMVSGFVCPDLARGVHPPELLPRLEMAGYRPEAELEAARQDKAALAADLAEALTTRLEVFQQILEEEDWDLAVAVLTDTDRANHFLWEALHEPGHPLAPAARRVFALADEFVGRAWARARPLVEAGRAAFMVAADHGFGPVVSEVYLNRWLVERGWLAVEGAPPAERILPATRALALDPGRIYLHRPELFPRGWLRPGAEAEQLLADLAADLLSIRFKRVQTGPDGPTVREEAPIAKVHLGRDLYHGPHAGLAPDLVCEPAPGYSLRAGLDRASVFGRSHIEGAHQPTGGLALRLPAPAARPRELAGLHGLMAEALGLGFASDGAPRLD